MNMKLAFIFLFFYIQLSGCLLPPKFQWKTMDYVWDSKEVRDEAIKNGDFVPGNVLPTGVARWRNKLFITVPRLKSGVPSSLNYILVNGCPDQNLNPYPSWEDGFIPDKAEAPNSNNSVVCAFKPYVDESDRLWVVDNGVADITGTVKQLTEPAVMVFDLTKDELIDKYVLPSHVLKECSVLTSIVIDQVPFKEGKTKGIQTFAYIMDMGSNAIIVYDMKNQDAWRVESPYFHFDPLAGKYKVGGLEFYWSDGVSSAALTKPCCKDGTRVLYFHPTSSTKQFRMSTKLLRTKDMPNETILDGVQVLGDKGPQSQATACDFDDQNNVLFFTQLSKNGLGCWNLDKPFTEENVALILSDCNIMEFPSDVKVDTENNIWILSNRQSRFLYGTLDPTQVNFRILSAPTADMIKDTPCERPSALSRAFSRRPRSGSTSSSCESKGGK